MLPASAAAQDFGLGLQFGDPTGLTLEYGLSERSSIQGTLGFGDFGHPRTMITADWNYDLLEKRPNGKPIQLALYLGVGGALGFYADRDCYRDRVTDRRVCYEDDGGLGLFL